MAVKESILNTLGTKLKFLALPSKFECEISFPGSVSAGENVAENLKFMAKATTIPNETLGILNLGYMGQKLKVPGDREYEDWTCTIYNSEEWDVRNVMEKWMKIINDPETNLKSPWEEITANHIKIHQLGASSLEPIATYVLKGAFPLTISEISLDWDTENEIETFDVTFAYNYHTRE